MTDRILTNARIVLDDTVMSGTVVIEDGRIAAVDDGASSLPDARDMEGDLLIPGLVELHTDNLERHMTPRPQADWPATAALIAHDAQVAVAGITTVFDAIAVGAVFESSARVKRLHEVLSAVATGVRDDLLRADHCLHLRCEVSFPDLQGLLDPIVGDPLVRLISVMDHTPGQRQFASEDKYRIYYKGKYGMSDADLDSFIVQRKADQQRHSAPNRRYVVERARERGLSLASHDDATAAHVDEAVADGMSIAEFPTTVDAADACHRGGLRVMMGAPNLVRGGSHSGNVSAHELARNGLLDIFSSDYVPNSLLHAAFLLYDDVEGYDLPRAIRLVTRTPAESAGLHDRGEIAVGKRADLVRVRHTPHHPLIRGVWREGTRIA
jgi:alpha-D-ribose 1-methylphosphonate 5-triphosphate diphosphatase